jgi:alcohol dehydrogenase YqhD (iron-dependent ADH family)
MGKDTIEEGIAALEAFYAVMGMPARLREFGLDEAALNVCATSACARTKTIGNFRKLESADVLKIYQAAF